MSRKRRPTTYDLKNDDLENDDLENDDLENDNLENDDLETTTSKTMTRKRWPRKRRPRKPILIDNNQTKKNEKKKKREQRTFIREKGDTWREVWLEVNRLSLQALSLFVHFATFFKTRDFILVPLFILHTRNDDKYLFNPTAWN